MLLNNKRAAFLLCEGLVNLLFISETESPKEEVSKVVFIMVVVGSLEEKGSQLRSDLCYVYQSLHHLAKNCTVRKETTCVLKDKDGDQMFKYDFTFHRKNGEAYQKPTRTLHLLTGLKTQELLLWISNGLSGQRGLALGQNTPKKRINLISLRTPRTENFGQKSSQCFTYVYFFFSFFIYLNVSK